MINIHDGSWFAIPTYAGRYYINKDGIVCNMNGHVIKPIKSTTGDFVELRMMGQRERILVTDLLSLVRGNHDENC